MYIVYNVCICTYMIYIYILRVKSKNSYIACISRAL